MFKLQYEGRGRDDYRPIGSGVAFGALGQPLYFRFTPDATGPGLPQHALPIEFVVVRDPARKPLEFAVEMGTDRLRLAFYNP